MQLETSAPTLLLRFPGRRYHATPWGHHVNEGLIEWPPSPWRLLRALLATGYTKLGWPADGPTSVARTLIEKLAGVLPEYGVTRAAGAHSRHYMPIGGLDKGRERTTLVFDTWAQIDDGELLVRWDVDLTTEELEVLRQLAENLGYLGRSESWTEARLASTEAPLPRMDRVVPCDSVTEPGPDWEQVALLSPVSPSEYIAWRQKVLAEALSKVKPMDSEKSKQTSAERKKSRAIEVAYPPDLIACLQVQSGWLQHFGWSQPPGTRRVFYWRRHVLETSAPALNLHSREPDTVEAALLSMATAGGNDHALPNITRTLPQAELLHRALIARASRAGRHSIILSGCDANCRPLQTSHRHAHVLPLDLDEDGHLDHILVWAPMGLDGYAQRIIGRCAALSLKAVQNHCG